MNMDTAIEQLRFLDELKTRIQKQVAESLLGSIKVPGNTIQGRLTARRVGVGVVETALDLTINGTRHHFVTQTDESYGYKALMQQSEDAREALSGAVKTVLHALAKQAADAIVQSILAQSHDDLQPLVNLFRGV